MSTSWQVDSVRSCIGKYVLSIARARKCFSWEIANAHSDDYLQMARELASTGSLFRTPQKLVSVEQVAQGIMSARRLVQCATIWPGLFRPRHLPTLRWAASCNPAAAEVLAILRAKGSTPIKLALGVTMATLALTLGAWHLVSIFQTHPPSSGTLA